VFDHAAVYDLLHPPGPRIARDGPAVLAWAAGGHEVLELACGTGAMARYLALAGHNVTASDLAPAMVAMARRRCADTVRVLEGDLAVPPAGPWDRILILGNSLNLLADHAAVTSALAAIRRVLAPGGQLLLQILNPRASGSAAPRLVTASGIIDGRQVVAAKSLVPQADGRLLTLSWGAAGSTASESAWLLDLDHASLGACLLSAGWASWTGHGGLDRRPFDAESSPELVIVVTVR
jgi:SAM-dependent methyltransferase